MSVLDGLREALKYATPQPPWDSVLEAVEHADDTGIDLHGANALLAKYAVNALPALLDIAEAAQPLSRLPFPVSVDERNDWRVYQQRLRDAFARLTEGERAS